MDPEWFSGGGALFPFLSIRFPPSPKSPWVPKGGKKGALNH
jgi:hypothetical protein